MGDMVMFKTSGISQTANFAVQAVTMIILSTTLSHLMQVASPAQPACTVKKLVVSLMNLLTMIRLRALHPDERARSPAPTVRTAVTQPTLVLMGSQGRARTVVLVFSTVI